jgi:hypothetical protein
MVFPPKNYISNLKFIFSQSNIEGFKQFCNSINFLYENMGKITYGDNNSNSIAIYFFNL